jgi:hypothetical protein
MKQPPILTDKPFSSKKLAKMLRERGYKPFKRHAGERRWWGIRLKEPGNGDCCESFNAKKNQKRNKTNEKPPLKRGHRPKIAGF